MRYDRERHVYLVGTIVVKQLEPGRFEARTLTGEQAFFIDIAGAQKCAEQWQLQGKG
jgi:hypothetical protein